MRKLGPQLNAWLGERSTWPVHAFMADEYEIPNDYMETLGRTLFSSDFVFLRDVMSREHWQLAGPDCSDEFIMSDESDHLGYSIIELDIDSPELAAMRRVAELTERYRI